MDKRLLFGTLFLLLPGCVSIPSVDSPVPPVPRAKIDDVVKLAKCDTKRIFRQYAEGAVDENGEKRNDAISQWLKESTPNITVQLTLKADAVGNISPSVGIIRPVADVVNSLGKFTGLNRTFGLSFSYNETDTRSLIFQFTMNARDLEKYSCDTGKEDKGFSADPCKEDKLPDLKFSGIAARDVCTDLNERIKAVFVDPKDPKKPSQLFLDWQNTKADRVESDAAHILGNPPLLIDRLPQLISPGGKRLSQAEISDWDNKEEVEKKKLISNAIRLDQTATANKVEPFDSLTYSIAFTVVTSGGFTPSIKLVHFSQAAAGGNNNMFGLSRTDTNTLAISIAKPQKPQGEQSSKNAAAVPSQQTFNDLLQLQLQRITILPSTP